MVTFEHCDEVKIDNFLIPQVQTISVKKKNLCRCFEHNTCGWVLKNHNDGFVDLMTGKGTLIRNVETSCLRLILRVHFCFVLQSFLVTS